MDFCFWGICEVSDRSIDHLPADCLANLWVEIGKRKRVEINAMNYSSASLAGAKYSAPGTKVNVKDWLPYNTDDGQEKAVALDASLQHEIYSMGLPPAMMRDLIQAKLITPRD